MSKRSSREAYFRYHVLQCVDEERDERLNVGVLLIDPESGQSFCEMASSLERVRLTLPNVPVEHLRSVLDNVQENARKGFSSEDLRELDRQAELQGGTLRLSSARSVLGSTLEETASHLFTRYVEVPSSSSFSSPSAALG